MKLKNGKCLSSEPVGKLNLKALQKKYFGLYQRKHEEREERENYQDLINA